MRIYFLKDFDGYRKGEHKFVEPTLGRRFCSGGIAIPYVTHLEQKQREAAEAKEAKAKERAEKKAKAAPKQRATSKRPTTRKKAVKK